MQLIDEDVSQRLIEAGAAKSIQTIGQVQGTHRLLAY